MSEKAKYFFSVPPHLEKHLYGKIQRY